MSHARRHLGTTATPVDLDDRPRPINTAAGELVRWVGIIGGIVVALVTGGVLSAVQGDAIAGLLGLVPGVLTAVASLLTAFGIRRRAEPLVTPLSDPRDRDLRALVAVPPGSRLVDKDDLPRNLRGDTPTTGGPGGVGNPARVRRPGTTHRGNVHHPADVDPILSDLADFAALPPRPETHGDNDLGRAPGSERGTGWAGGESSAPAESRAADPSPPSGGDCSGASGDSSSSGGGGGGE